MVETTLLDNSDMDISISELIEQFSILKVNDLMPPKLRSANRDGDDLYEMETSGSNKDNGIPARNAGSMGEVAEAYETPVGDISTQEDEFVSDESNPPDQTRLPPNQVGRNDYFPDQENNERREDGRETPIRKGMVVEMMEEIKLETRLANETNRMELKQQLHHIEEKLRRDRAELEVERMEREKNNQRLHEELDTLRTAHIKGQRSLEAGLMSVE